ncbi:hypothetical protein GUJ93_ZPchr0308g33403 [Zizania palustris]|uniref:Uncharacterized protein n=1 Tax=Zizania palustris TaxID=103762 RepID=A0A8J5VE88_ZIZPA|nr:hypothetical protein GUJ93_ZPchr0308g33403 [Zizania palustris]
MVLRAQSMDFQVPNGQGFIGLCSSGDLTATALRMDFVWSQDPKTHSRGSRSQADALATENAQHRVEHMRWR